MRANADTPTDARVARKFGAEGIGLCRTEHMFFEGDRIVAVREMILADDEKGRRAALAKLLPMQRGDFADLFAIMAGLPVTIRLLDPPLHEFLPHTDEEIAEVARSDRRRSVDKLRGVPHELQEIQSDARLRGCRLAIAYPEDRRDAGARDFRGGGRSREEDRQAGRARRSWCRSSRPGPSSISSRHASTRWRAAVENETGVNDRPIRSAR